MKLAMTLKFSPASGVDMDLVWEAERLGYDAVWCGEAYGTDAVTPVAWVLAQTKNIKAGTGIMQMPARTPACAAMTAMTLQALSGNRFLCGVGPSGPQVVEGWHGVPFGKPLARTREYIAIIRRIIAREAPLEFQGEHYQIPYTRPRCDRARQAAEEHHSRRSKSEDLHRGVRAGRAAHRGRGSGRHAADLHVAGEGRDDHRTRCWRGWQRREAGRTSPISTLHPMSGSRRRRSRRLSRRDRPQLALYIGGMGARSKNFYNDYSKAASATKRRPVAIQDLFLAGRRKEAERRSRRADRRDFAGRVAGADQAIVCTPGKGSARTIGSARWC